MDEYKREIIFWNDRYNKLKSEGHVGMMNWHDPIKEEDMIIKNLVEPLIEKGNILLDFGCGVGDRIGTLKDIFDFSKYIGYDISEIALDESKKIFPEYSFYLYKDTTILKKADYCYMHGVLQHLLTDEALDKILTKLHKAISKKIFIIDNISNMPNKSYIFYRSIEEHTKIFERNNFKSNFLGSFNVSNEKVGIFELWKE